MVMHNPSLLAGPRQDRDIRGVSPKIPRLTAQWDSGRGQPISVAAGYILTVGNFRRRWLGRLRTALAIWHDVLQ
jgi:hypothetical protein